MSKSNVGMTNDMVGVAVGIRNIPGSIGNTNQLVGVAEGGAPGTGVWVGALVGGATGVGGAAITASVAGIQVAVVTLAAIQA